MGPATHWRRGWVGLRSGLDTDAVYSVLVRTLNVHTPTTVTKDAKKLELSHYTPRRRFGERMYSSYSFLTSVLDGDEWSASRPCRDLAPGKGPSYPLYRMLGGPQSWFGHRGVDEKFFRLCRGSNICRTVVQPVAIHYTD
jgi:hypothetical protein